MKYVSEYNSCIYLRGLMDPQGLHGKGNMLYRKLSLDFHTPLAVQLATQVAFVNVALKLHLIDN